MSEVPKRWVVALLIGWLVLLNGVLLVGPYVAPVWVGNILLLGRLSVAGMMGVWAVMGAGMTALRLSGIVVVAGILAVIDWQLIPGEVWIFVGSYFTTITGAAMVGMIGNFLRGPHSDQIDRRPQFSIVEIAGWTAVVAAVLGLSVLVPENAMVLGAMEMLILLWFHGVFVGILCLPLYVASGNSRGRWIGGAILAAVLFLFLECGVFCVYKGKVPGDPYFTDELISMVVLTKFPAIIITLATIVPLGFFPLWREVDVFESPEPPPGV